MVPSAPVEGTTESGSGEVGPDALDLVHQAWGHADRGVPKVAWVAHVISFPPRRTRFRPLCAIPMVMAGGMLISTHVAVNDLRGNPRQVVGVLSAPSVWIAQAPRHPTESKCAEALLPSGSSECG